MTKKTFGYACAVGVLVIALQELVTIPHWLMETAWLCVIAFLLLQVFGPGKQEDPRRLAAIVTLGAMVMIPPFHRTANALVTAIFEHHKPWADALFLSRSSLSLAVIYLFVAYVLERQFTERLARDHQRLSRELDRVRESQAIIDSVNL